MKIDDTKKEGNFEDSGFTPVDPEEIQYVKTIQEIKRKYKRVYETSVAGEKVLWRPLKRSEYKEMFDLEFPEGTDPYDIAFERETFIASKVVLYPTDIVEEVACCAEIIAKVCMTKSGFADTKDPDCKEV